MMTASGEGNTGLSPAKEELLRRWVSGRKRASATIPRRADEGPRPLTRDQERLWFLEQVNPGNPAYHVPVALRVRGPLDRGAVERSWSAVCQRHEALRTTVTVENGRPLQAVRALAGQSVEWHDVNVAGDRHIAECVQRPFDLAAGPLARLHVIRASADEHILVLVFHHVVADAWSAVLVAQQLLASLAGGAVGREPEVALAQYPDFVAWRLESVDALVERQLPYWRQRLAGAPTLSTVAPDRSRPALLSQSGGHVFFVVEGALLEGLRNVARGARATLFMALLAGLQALLNRCNGQDDLLVGCPVSGRSHPATRDLVGFLANTLILRTDLSGDPSFATLLRRVREEALAAYDHQDVPFATVVEAVRPERSLGHNPLFQVMLNVVPLPDLEAELSGMAIRAEPVDVAPGATDYDLFLTVCVGRTALRCTLGYSGDLFDQETAQALADGFVGLLAQVVANPELPLSRLDLPGPLRGRASRDSASTAEVVVAATFNAEPLADALDYWLRRLALPLRARFAPYNQLFQQLADPSGPLLRNRGGTNVLLVRWADWRRDQDVASPEEARDSAARALNDLVAAVRSAAERVAVPWVVVVSPADNQGDQTLALLDDLLTDELGRALRPITNVEVVTPGQLAARYPVDDVFDPRADRAGHVPFTEEAYAALATEIARRVYLYRRAPFKVIALDCDQTLWRGVLGEDGPDGIQVDPARVRFQEFLVGQQRAGMLLCLCSKNEEADVLEAFRRRPDMPLRLEHLAAWRIGWQPKAWSLQDLAAELRLGVDSFVLVDDDPVECAEVKAACPEVVVLRLPQVEAELDALLAHAWCFDHAAVTAEGLSRTRLYQEDVPRQRALMEAPSLADFLAGLELRVDIAPMALAEAERVAELTVRTTQFHAAPCRRSVADLSRLSSERLSDILVVRVRDRFGDYGLVGVLALERADDLLLADTFLLSCRALGKGVEHRMLGRMGAVAAERGLGAVGVRVRATPRSLLYRLDTARAAAVRYDPARIEGSHTTPLAESRRGRGRPEASALARIAEEGWHPAALLAAVRETRAPGRVVRRAEYVAPRDEIARLIAAAWQEALGTERVGLHDNFFDLGGHSLLLVQVSSKLEKALGREVRIVDLFQYPTVGALAGYLAGHEPSERKRVTESQHRGAQQREVLLRYRRAATQRST